MTKQSLITIGLGIVAIVAGALLPAAGPYLFPAGAALIGLGLPQPGAKK